MLNNINWNKENGLILRNNAKSMTANDSGSSAIVYEGKIVYTVRKDFVTIMSRKKPWDFQWLPIVENRLFEGDFNRVKTVEVESIMNTAVVEDSEE